MIACFLTLPSTPRHGSTKDKIRRIDFLGFGILSASLVCFLVPLMQVRATLLPSHISTNSNADTSQAGVVYSWTDIKTLLPLLSGLVGIFAFLIFEHRYAKHPLVPLSRFSNRTCILAFLCSCAHGLALWCLMYYIPFYYEFVQGFDTIKSGVATLPELLTIVFGAAGAGYVVSWTGKYRWMIWQGWAIAAFGMGILMLLGEKTPTASWIGLNIPIGLGMGFLFGSLQFAIQASVEPEQLPIAVALFMFWRSFGAVS